MLLLTTYFHLITLSGRASKFGGIVKPICFVAFRLLTNSNFVEAQTGALRHFVHKDNAALSLSPLVQLVDETALVQLFDESDIDKILGLGSLCLGVRLRQRL